jgi:hypothetical protein
VCGGYWKLVESNKARTRWTCTAKLAVRLVDDETDLGYGRLRCKKKRRRHPGAAAP